MLLDGTPAVTEKTKTKGQTFLNADALKDVNLLLSPKMNSFNSLRGQNNWKSVECVSHEKWVKKRNVDEGIIEGSCPWFFLKMTDLTWKNKVRFCLTLLNDSLIHYKVSDSVTTLSIKRLDGEIMKSVSKE